MSIPEFVRKAYPTSLPLREGLEVLAASDDVGDASKAGLKSTALDAVRYATRDGLRLPSKEEALEIDIRPLLAVLPAAARVAAEAKDHRSPGDHERRARRFVECLTGGRSVDRTKLRFPCPPAWQPLVEAMPDRKNANGEMSFLHRCCMVAGFQDSPATMPAYAELVEAARQINGEIGVRRATKAGMPQYRTARQRLIDEAKDNKQRETVQRRFAVLPTAASPRTCHLGVEPETIRLLKSCGRFEPGMTPEAMFRALAPALAKDYDCWADRPGAQLSASFREQCLGTLLRVTGWVVRAGHGARLRDVQLLDLFLVEIPEDDPIALNPRLARRLGDSGGESTLSILEYAAESEAEDSLHRSTVTEADVAGSDQDGKPWFTDAMHANCSRIWSMTVGLFGEMAAKGGLPAKEWTLVESRWWRLQKRLTDRKLPPRFRLSPKDKLKMVQTVTLPQLVCVGMPLRRREIRALREEWLAALKQAEEADHKDPHAHPEVRDAERVYFEAAFRFSILCLAVDDGLRRKQYVRGRLGLNANFRIKLELDSKGNPAGIKSMTTHWTGDARDPAHLKITNKNRTIARREDRKVRRGFVDHVVLWDLIRHWRPRQLVSNGSVPKLASYRLLDDLREGKYALFPSPVEVPRPDRSRTDIGDLFGRELHYIVRTWLRPDLPVWEDLGGEWRELWAIHITRLLIGSYWGGARDDWTTARYLTTDTEGTLRKEYSLIDEGLRDRLGPDRTDWEHLNAFDPWLDRLYYHHEEFDPMGDPALPLPPHLKGRIHNQGTVLPKKRRIRRARPGQKGPKSR